MALLTARKNVKASVHKNQNGFQNRLISIPDLGVDYYQRDIYDDGHIEFTPIEFMKSAIGVKNGNE